MIKECSALRYRRTWGAEFAFWIMDRGLRLIAIVGVSGNQVGTLEIGWIRLKPSQVKNLRLSHTRTVSIHRVSTGLAVSSIVSLNRRVSLLSCEYRSISVPLFTV